MHAEPLQTDIFPPVAYAQGWWLLVAGCLLGTIAVAWWLRRTLHTLRATTRGADDLGALRSEALAEIDAILELASSGGLVQAAAHQRLSAAVRRFAGIATNGDADYQALPQLRRAAVKDPRLAPVVEFVALVEPAAFGGHSEISVVDSAARARSVVESWA